MFIAASLHKKDGESKAKWHPVTGPVSKLEAQKAVAAEWALGRFARVIPEKKPAAAAARKPA